MKKIFAIILTLCMMTSLLCFTVFAEEGTGDVVISISGLKADGTTIGLNSWTNFADGWEAAVDFAEDEDFMEDNDLIRIVVDFYADWNANAKGEFGKSSWDGFQYSTIYVPSDTRMTINLNGHTINRGLTKCKYNGEVICINDDADLIINGGKSGDPITRADKENADAPFGTITGGFSCNGAGGIHMQDGSKLTLNNVKVVGNKAEDDDGGGIAVYDGAILTVNGGSISDNLLISDVATYIYGAGIYVEDSTAYLNHVMLQNNNSNGKPEYNAEGRYHCYGAAIYVDDSSVTVDSCLFDSNGQHIGYFLDSDCVIYVYDDSKMTVRQTTFRRNGSAQRVVKGHTSLEYGTDLFNVDDDSSLILESCYFTENSAEIILNVGYDSALSVDETIFKNNYAAVYNYYGSASDTGRCTFTKCTVERTSPKENYPYAFNLKTAGNHPTFIECNLGNATFSDRRKAKIEDSKIPSTSSLLTISIFGEGSLSMIVATFALVASAASIGVIVASNKKKAVSDAANNEGNEKEES